MTLSNSNFVLDLPQWQLAYIADVPSRVKPAASNLVDGNRKDLDTTSAFYFQTPPKPIRSVSSVFCAASLGLVMDCDTGVFF